MKKIIFILLAAVSFAWFGCSKKNTVTPLTPATATQNDLLGKWNGTKAVVNDTVNHISTTKTLTPGQYYIQFNSDNTGSIGGDQQTPDVFTYAVSAGMIPITNNNGVSNLIIRTITKTTLVLSSEENKNQDIYFSR